MSVLVAGGAGYIGSVTAKILADSGRKVVVYDNLSRGHAQAVSPECVFVEGDLATKSFYEKHLRSMASNR